MDLRKILEIYKKYNWLIVIVLFVYSIFKTIAPKEVKVIKTEHTVIDRTEEMKLKSQINTLKQKIKNFSREIKEDEVVTETKYPDGKIERRIEKKKVVSEHGTSSEVSSSSTTTDVASKTKEHTDKTDTETTVVSPYPFWASMVGYQFNSQSLTIGQGINISKHWTGIVLISYNLKEGTLDRFDYGGQIQIRY